METLSSPSAMQRGAQAELPELGTCIDGRYTLRTVIGLGGMACVFEARHEALDKTVAVKVLLPRFAGKDSEGAARFLTEARAASKINHPGVVELSDFGHTDDGLPYFVMECLEGSPLDVVLETRGALPVEEAVQLVEQILDVLSAAHAAGVIHRDIKPGNCMVTPDGLKLLDFGIAQVRETEHASRLTAEGNAIGTPHYMAPEQALGKRVDARADLYACAILLFEVLTGAPPFDNATPVTLMARHITESAPDLPEKDMHGSLIPAAVRSAVERALAKNPEDRYATAEDFRAALRRTPPAPATSSHRIATVAGLLVGALVLAGIGVGARLAQPPPSKAAAMVSSLRAQPHPVPPQPALAQPPTVEPTQEPAPEPPPPAPALAAPLASSPAPHEEPVPTPKKRRKRTPNLQGQLEALISACSSFGSPGGQPLKLSVQVALDGQLSSTIVAPPYAGTPLGRCAARSLNAGSVRAPDVPTAFRGALRLRSASNPKASE